MLLGNSAVKKHDVSDMLSHSKAGHNLLKRMRDLKNTLKENVVDTSIFGEFNLDYYGPVDGHDLHMLIKVLEVARKKPRSMRHDWPEVATMISR